METSRTPIFRRYEVVAKIGSGGMGTVYKARDTHLGRLVALKVLPPGLQEDDDALERFKRESRALARLKHPRVASVYDAHVEGGFPHLVMELVDGETLERMLKARRSLTAEETARIGIDICEALEHIHAHRIVHRDVKSSNIIMEPRIGAVLADFGIALEASLPRISQGALGTPEYMSPEQAEGRELDGRSDLYSVGVVLFECLTGRTPFRRSDDSLASLMKLLKRITDESVPPLHEIRSDTPTWMADIVARCLEKDPDRRFASAVELASALRDGLTEAGTALLSDPDEEVPEAPAGPSRRRFVYSPAENDGAKERVEADPSLGDRCGKLGPDSPVPEQKLLHPAKRANGEPSSEEKKPPKDALRESVSSPLENAEHAKKQPDWTRRAAAELKKIAAGDAPPAGLRDPVSEEKDLLKRRQMMVITHLRPVQAVAFDPDGKRLASASDDGVVRIWQASDGRLLQALEAHEGSVSSVTFSPDGRLVASGDIFGKICLWDAATGRLVRSIDGLTALIMALAFSPDGKTLASGGADRAVRLWHVKTGHLSDTIGRHLGYVLSASFSRDGGRIATSGSDGQVIVWDLGRKVLALSLNAHKGWAVSADFSPDGQRLVSGGSDHMVKVWNASKGTIIHEMTGHSGGVMATAFSPSGTMVASAGRDRTVRLWDVKSGRCVSRLTGHAGAVTALSFSPTGSHLAAGSDDRTARIWFLDRKAFQPRRPLKRMIGWAAIAVLALASIAGPLDLRRIDLGETLERVESAMPNLSGAALEGTLLSGSDPEPAEPAEKEATDTPTTEEEITVEQLAELRNYPRPSTVDHRPSILDLPTVQVELPTPLPTAPNPPPHEPAADEREAVAAARDTFSPLLGGGDLVRGRPGWTILVGSLRSLHAARWLVGHYRDLGLRAGILAIPSSGDWEYLVGVGQFESADDARKVVDRMKGRELPFRTQIERLRWERVTASR